MAAPLPPPIGGRYPRDFNGRNEDGEEEEEEEEKKTRYHVRSSLEGGGVLGLTCADGGDSAAHYNLDICRFSAVGGGETSSPGAS